MILIPILNELLLTTLQLQRPFTVYGLFRYQDTVTNLVVQREEHKFMAKNY